MAWFATKPAALVRGAGRAGRFVAQAVIWLVPSLSLPTWAIHTALVGALPSVPPYTYRKSPDSTATPSVRAPGIGPPDGAQACGAPFVSTVDFHTVLTALEPLPPPTRNRPSAAGTRT